MNQLAGIHAKISTVCPIDGIARDGRIDFRPEATAEQRKAAAAIMAAVDWEAEESKEKEARAAVAKYREAAIQKIAKAEAVAAGDTVAVAAIDWAGGK